MTDPTTPTGKRIAGGYLSATQRVDLRPEILAIEAEAYESALLDVLRARPVCEQGHRNGEANPHIHFDDAHETARQMLAKRGAIR